MAVSSNSRTARSANPNFDPAAWLSQFREAGGWWIVGADDRVYIGWQKNRWQIGDIGPASALWGEIQANPSKTGQLWDMLRSCPPRHPDAQSAPTASSMSFIAGAIKDPGEGGASKSGLSYDGASDPCAAWETAFAAFERADRFEALFRDTVYGPADAVQAAGGAPISASIEHLMDEANEATDDVRRIALRTPAPNSAALRWKLEQFLIEKVMPFPPAGEIEQVLADLDRLTGEA